MNTKVSKFLSILKLIGPSVIAIAVPGSGPIVALIQQGIAEAEQMPGATGPQKKAHALEIVKAGVSALNTATKKETVNVAGAMSTADAAISATVGVINIMQGLQGVGVAVPPEPAPNL